MIIYSKQRPTRARLFALYDAVGWTAYTRAMDKLETAISRSIFITAWDSDHLVGLIRGITDGATILYIQDLLVLPSFQRQGIAKTLVHRFMQEYPMGQTVLLTDDTPETTQFYEAVGLQDVSKEAMRAWFKDARK